MFYTINNRTVNDFFNSLDEIFTSSGYPSSLESNGYRGYKTHSDEDGITLTMNVPGYNKKLIDVSIEGDSLVIKGQANSGDTDGFDKSFTLGDKLDAGGIEATVVDGVLTVNVPYREEVKPRKVEIKVK